MGLLFSSRSEIVEIVDRLIGRSAAEAPVKFQSDAVILIHLAAFLFHDISRYTVL